MEQWEERSCTTSRRKTGLWGRLGSPGQARGLEQCRPLAPVPSEVPSLSHARAPGMLNKEATCGLSWYLPKPSLPWHQDQNTQATGEGHLAIGNSPPRFFKGTKGGLLGVSSLLGLVNYLLSSWENKNISGFLFAEIITYRWLLGFVSCLKMMAVTVHPRVKPFFWACVSFHSITHSLPASISSSVLGLAFVIHLACTMSCLLFLELRVRISNVIVWILRIESQ